MRLKFIKQITNYVTMYQLGSYRVFMMQDNPKTFVLHRYRAKSLYVPDILWFNGELKIQQDVHWGAVNVRQAEAICAGYQEAIEVIKFMGRFLK
nr:MAG TPA: hypothetical protein [Caudoviricetes sp.]